MSDAPRFDLGVNYWPAAAALAWWPHHDPGIVRADFARIAAAGLDVVRIFLTWEAFQPTVDRVDPEMIERLVRTADLAAAAGLTIMPTLFTGHMSGVNLLPPWAVAPGGEASRFRVMTAHGAGPGRSRSWYDDPEIVDAQVRLASRCAAAVAGHPALAAWDLGNENSNCSIPSSHAAARAWLGRVTGAIRTADPAAAITIGLHMEDLESDRRLGPAEAAASCDFLSMHGYPIYAPFAGGPTDHRLLGFLTEITRWLGAGADVMFTEFGLPTRPAGAPGPDASSSMLVDEADAARYTAHALMTLRRAGATGALLWCANDYAPEVWRVPPFDTAIHERHFGLWRHDGSPKPSVPALAFDRMTAATPRDHGDRSPAPDSWLDLDPVAFFTPDGSHLSRLYARYCAALDEPSGS